MATIEELEQQIATYLAKINNLDYSTKSSDDECWSIRKSLAEAYLSLGNEYCKAEKYELGVMNYLKIINLNVEYINKNISLQFSTDAKSLPINDNVLLGACFFYGIGVKRCHDTALIYFKKALAENDYKPVFFDLVQNNISKQEVTNLLLKGAEQNHPWSQYCYAMKMISENNVSETDYQSAIPWLLKSANQGFNLANLELYEIYKYGLGVAYDFHLASEYFKKYQAQGDYGHRISSTDDKFIGYCIDAQNGNAASQYLVAEEFLNKYENRRIVTEHIKKLGIEFYLKSAKQGNKDAQYKLGEIYQEGMTGLIEKDEKIAFQWYMKAAQQGHDKAIYNVGLCYKNGSGIEKNADLALVWFRKYKGYVYTPTVYFRSLYEEASHSVEMSDGYRLDYLQLKVQEGLEQLIKCCDQNPKDFHCRYNLAIALNQYKDLYEKNLDEYLKEVSKDKLPLPDEMIAEFNNAEMEFKKLIDAYHQFLDNHSGYLELKEKEKVAHAKVSEREQMLSQQNNDRMDEDVELTKLKKEDADIMAKIMEGLNSINDEFFSDKKESIKTIKNYYKNVPLYSAKKNAAILNAYDLKFFSKPSESKKRKREEKMESRYNDYMNLQ